MAAEVMAFLGLSNVSPTIQYCLCFALLIIGFYLVKDIVLRLLGG